MHREAPSRPKRIPSTEPESALSHARGKPADGILATFAVTAGVTESSLRAALTLDSHDVLLAEAWALVEPGAAAQPPRDIPRLLASVRDRFPEQPPGSLHALLSWHPEIDTGVPIPSRELFHELSGIAERHGFQVPLSGRTACAFVGAADRPSTLLPPF